MDYLNKGAITVIDVHPDQFVSRIFEVPKKTGDFRLILDLSDLNLYLKKVHFKMDGLSSIASIIGRGDFLASLDLQDAFLTIAMHPSCYKYLCFDFEGVRYCFIALVFGLSCAPRIFTKLLKVPLSCLRLQGYKNSAWLDDILLVGSSLSNSLASISHCRGFLESLGFIIKPSKSHLTPSQSLTSDSFGIPSTILFLFPLRRFPPFRAFAHLLFLMLFLYVFLPRLSAPLTAFTLAFPTLLSTTGTFNSTLFHTSLFLGAGTSRSGCPLLPVQTLNGGWGAIFTSHLLLYLPSLPLIVWRPMLASWVGVPSHILPCSLRVDGALRSLVFTSTTLNSLLSSWASRPSSKAVPISPFLSYVIIFPPLDILIAWVVLSLDSSALWHWRFGITAWPILFS